MNLQDAGQIFWATVRPLHSPVTRALRRRLGRGYADHPEMELPPAYDFIQLETERRLHQYLHCSAKQVEQIVIIGANEGGEIPRLRRSYPHGRFLCFEPSPRWFRILDQRFRGADYVETRELALSDTPGTAVFHELPLAGNGSLLAPDPVRWSQFTETKQNDITSFEVSCSTLDQEATALERIDLLWIDVQGAEFQVLRGATETLTRVEALFLEVALVESPYQGGSLLAQLDSFLKEFGFTSVGLGLDPGNYTGNGLWIKNTAAKLDGVRVP